MEWGLSRFAEFSEFLHYAKTRLKLRSVQLQFPDRDIEAVVWGEPEPLEVWRALGNDAFLSHYTALHLHGLSDDLPRYIYVSVPTRPRRPPQPLTEAQIMSSMPGAPRSTKSRCQLGDSEIVLLNQQLPDLALPAAITTFDTAPRHRLASIENALLQSVMRPDYCGGFAVVVEAFRRARERTSGNRVRALLSAVQYAYPYIQSLGFLMSRTGHSQRSLQIMRRDAEHFVKFFVARGEPDQMRFDSDWQVYYPPVIDELAPR